MTVTLGRKEIGAAVLEYLERRGIPADSSRMNITYNREQDEFYVIVKDVEISPKEGPYR